MSEDDTEVAAEHGWTTAPVGNIGRLYCRDGETLRVCYTNAGRRTVREYEHERPASPGRNPSLVHGGPSERGKRAAVVAILAAERAPVGWGPGRDYVADVDQARAQGGTIVYGIDENGVES